MKQPNFRTMLLGHPLVAVPVTLANMAAIYCLWRAGGEGLALGIIPLAMIAATARANQEVSAYRRWQREWAAMSGVPDARLIKLKGLVGIFCGVVLVFGGAAAFQSHPSAVNSMLGWIALISTILVAWLLVRWMRRRRSRSERAVAVKVIAKPILPAPTLAAAYAALPEHCQRLLANSRSQ